MTLSLVIMVNMKVTIINLAYYVYYTEFSRETKAVYFYIY